MLLDNFPLFFGSLSNVGLLIFDVFLWVML